MPQTNSCFQLQKQISQVIYPHHIRSIKPQWTFPPMISSIGVFQWFCYSMCDLQVTSVRTWSAQYSTKHNDFLRAELSL